MSDRCWLECVACGRRVDLQPLLHGCPACAGRGVIAPLEVRYDMSRVGALESANGGLWRWRGLLPELEDAHVTSLGEGSTPLRPLPAAGGRRLYLKNETVNPTWSWKDRSISVSVSMARAFGFRRIAAVSTGNHGVAASAYSASAGCECLIFCHQDAPELQPALMQYYGARVLRGGLRERMLTRLVKQGGWFPASIYCPSDGTANPFGVEGFKTIAFEIFEQLGQRLPDSVFVPTGSGDGLFGIYKGFRELRDLGRTDRLPRIILCQAAAVAPYVRAFRTGARKVEAVIPQPTAALSIAEPVGGPHALRGVYDSGGEAVDVTEEEIQNAARFAAQNGYAIEPASAAALACAQKLGDSAGELMVVVASGAAVKWPPVILQQAKMPACLPADFEAVEEAYDSLP